MLREWRERGMFGSTKERVCDQKRIIRKNLWLSERELEAIERQEEDESQSELCRKQEVAVDVETLETDVERVEAEINDAEDSVGDTEGNLSAEHQAIVEKLKKIVVEGRTRDGIMSKKVGKNVLKIQTYRVNEVIKYLKSKSITETSNLIRAANV